MMTCSVNEKSKMRIAQKIVDENAPSYFVRNADGFYKIYDDKAKLLEPQNIMAGQTVCVIGDIEGITASDNPKELTFSVKSIQHSNSGEYVIQTEKGLVTSVDVRDHVRFLNEQEMSLERC